MKVLNFRRTSTAVLTFGVLAVAAFVYSSGAHAQAQTPMPAAPAATADSTGATPKAATHEGRSHGMHKHGGDRMWMRLDTDKDGQISKAELLASQQRQLEMFDRADADKNGKLSAEERKAFRAAKRAS
jgi:hypothetical protein